MYNCDDTIIRYGHLICQYLSHNFGCDIIFVDAQYRQRDLVGQPNYVGNKANAEKIIKEIRFWLSAILHQKRYLIMK